MLSENIIDISINKRKSPIKRKSSSDIEDKIEKKLIMIMKITDI